ncbi:MAG: hypothetical protein DDT20_00853 [Firmicutes bacterium]|nr:hypothetical protein [Bacillota bacterium]
MWLIGLEQKNPPEFVRYFTGVVSDRWVSGLTAAAGHAASYQSSEEARRRVGEIPKHPWGVWKVVDRG